MPRPSGNVHSPARANLSGRMPLTWRPITWKQPFVGWICPLATLSVVDFPRSAGPEQRQDLAGRDGQVDAVQDLDLPVAGVDPAELDDGREQCPSAMPTSRAGARQTGARDEDVAMRPGSSADSEVGGAHSLVRRPAPRPATPS